MGVGHEPQGILRAGSAPPPPATRVVQLRTPPTRLDPHLERVVEALKFRCFLLHHLLSGPRQRGRGRRARGLARGQGAAGEGTLRAVADKGGREWPRPARREPRPGRRGSAGPDPRARVGAGPGSPGLTHRDQARTGAAVPPPPSKTRSPDPAARTARGTAPPPPPPPQRTPPPGPLPPPRGVARAAPPPPLWARPDPAPDAGLAPPAPPIRARRRRSWEGAPG